MSRHTENTDPLEWTATTDVPLPDLVVLTTLAIREIERISDPDNPPDGDELRAAGILASVVKRHAPIVGRWMMQHSDRIAAAYDRGGSSTSSPPPTPTRRSPKAAQRLVQAETVGIDPSAWMDLAASTDCPDGCSADDDSGPCPHGYLSAYATSR